MPKANRPFERGVSLVCSMFSHGPKRLIFCFWVLWATEEKDEGIAF